MKGLHQVVRALGALLAVAILVTGCSAIGAKSTPTAPSRPSVGPPAATPLANPPSQPAGSGATATIETDQGTIVIKLYDESSPVAATNFMDLASAGFYDGTTFHRLVPGFVIQGGDPLGNGT